MALHRFGAGFGFPTPSLEFFDEAACRVGRLAAGFRGAMVQLEHLRTRMAEVGGVDVEVDKWEEKRRLALVCGEKNGILSTYVSAF